MFGKLLRTKLMTGDAKKAGNQCFSTWLSAIFTTATCFRRTSRPISIMIHLLVVANLNESVWSVCHPPQRKPSTRHKIIFDHSTEAWQIKFQTDVIDFEHVFKDQIHDVSNEEAKSHKMAESFSDHCGRSIFKWGTELRWPPYTAAAAPCFRCLQLLSSLPYLWSKFFSLGTKCWSSWEMKTKFGVHTDKNSFTFANLVVDRLDKVNWGKYLMINIFG